MISPTRYNLNFFIFSLSFSVGEEEVQGDSLVKEDDLGVALEMLPYSH